MAIRKSSSARSLLSLSLADANTPPSTSVAIARAVSSVFLQEPPPGTAATNHDSPRGITIAPARPATDRDAIEGYMILHAKKPKKKLFHLHRSNYYVVADANKPVLELYNNETRSELIYVLSLAGAELGFESDDAHAVMAKCFCVQVKTWKKRDTVHLRPQGFVFFQENQALMLVWVKCIHTAIKNAARSAGDRAADDQLFRSSTASTAASEPPSGDEADQVTRERTVHSIQEQSSSSHDDGPSLTSSRGNDDVVVAPGGPSLSKRSASPSKRRIDGRCRAPIDPLTSPSSASSPIGSRPSQFPRLHSVFATMKSPTNTAMDPKECSASAPSDKIPPSSFSPKIIRSLHMPKTKSSSTRQVTAVAKSPVTNKRSSDTFQFRKRDDGLFSGLTPFFSPRGPRSAPKQKSACVGDKNFCTGYSGDPVSQPLADFLRNDVVVDEGAPLQSQQPLEFQVSAHLTRFIFLLVACIGGVYQVSVFLPVAAAGVFAYADVRHLDDFPSAAMSASLVYVASSFQLSLGACSILSLLYGWSYADFKTYQRMRRRRLAEKLAEEESVNFAHVEIPNWVLRPDVDRVDWLNKVLHTGWPYMKLAIRNSLLWSLNPLLESSRPTFMSSLALAKIDLGNKPPIISGVKFVNAPSTKAEEVTLDVEVRIVSDDSLLAELRMVSNLGAAAVVSLKDLFLVGTLRVTLTPLTGEYWPCFSALSLSFTDRPVFDFSLTAAKINIANVPFASEWLHTFLHDLLMDYFVWPKVVNIPLWDETTST